MHFGLTDEQKLLQATLREFAAKELPAPRLRELFDAGVGHDPGLWRGLAEVGLSGLVVPEAHGGAGLELLDMALASEVLGETAMPGSYLSHALASLALVEAGSDAQRERWLPRLASGAAIGSVALAESSGWAREAWRTRLDARALEGEKRHVEAAQHAQVFVVGTADGGLALVDAEATGVSVTAADGLDRTRALAALRFAGAEAEVLPGGATFAPRLHDAACILISAEAFGAAWRMIRMTVEYVLTREQFGTPLAQFQGVKHQLANLAAETEPMRGLFWYAAHAYDHRPDEVARAAAVAKAHITERALEVGRMAIELHGGNGFTWECDLQFFMKRAMFASAWLGTPGMHRARIAELETW